MTPLLVFLPIAACVDETELFNALANMQDPNCPSNVDDAAQIALQQCLEASPFTKSLKLINSDLRILIPSDPTKLTEFNNKLVSLANAVHTVFSDLSNLVQSALQFNGLRLVLAEILRSGVILLSFFTWNFLHTEWPLTASDVHILSRIVNAAHMDDIEADARAVDVNAKSIVDSKFLEDAAFAMDLGKVLATMPQADLFESSGWPKRRRSLESCWTRVKTGMENWGRRRKR